MKKKEVRITTKSSQETIDLGKKLSSCLKKGDLILVKGELGAGKSTLIKGIASGIGVKDEVKSPSFIIVNELEGDDVILYHIDLYRIEGKEIFTLGFDEFLSNGIVVIEWADKIENFLNGIDFIDINIEIINENERKINIVFNGEELEKRCSKFL